MWSSTTAPPPLPACGPPQLLLQCRSQRRRPAAYLHLGTGRVRHPAPRRSRPSCRKLGLPAPVASSTPPPRCRAILTHGRGDVVHRHPTAANLHLSDLLASSPSSAIGWNVTFHLDTRRPRLLEPRAEPVHLPHPPPLKTPDRVAPSSFFASNSWTPTGRIVCIFTANRTPGRARSPASGLRPGFHTREPARQTACPAPTPATAPACPRSGTCSPPYANTNNQQRHIPRGQQSTLGRILRPDTRGKFIDDGPTELLSSKPPQRKVSPPEAHHAARGHSASTVQCIHVILIATSSRSHKLPLHQVRHRYAAPRTTPYSQREYPQPRPDPTAETI